jgi:hypothetical protein
MLLSDLVDHTPAQRKAISQVNPTDLCDPRLPHWEEFRKSLWNNGIGTFQNEEDVERDNNPVDNCHILPDPLPDTRSVMTPPETLPGAWSDQHSLKILVRSEYHEAEQAALLANEDNRTVFMVAGQSGIGMHPFLFFSIASRT